MAVLFSLSLLLCAVRVAAQPQPAPTPGSSTTVLAALQRSLGWLEANPTDPRRERLGWVTLDTWAWYVYAKWYPDQAVRTRAAGEVDRRLRNLTPPAEWTVASLSQWATVLQIASLRGMPSTSHHGALANVDVAAALREANPTTAWWTAELLRTAGYAVKSDFSSSFVASESPRGAKGYVPKVRDAYRVFHELVPASRLGTTEPTQLTPTQLSFVREIMPGLIQVSREAGDTDAVAEALVSAALVDGCDTTAYRDGLTWLLARQREDGTYRSARDARRALDSDAFRHVVLVASHALLTSRATVPDKQP